MCDWEGCERAFTRKAHLDRHVTSFHKQEKPFVCEECGKAYTSRGHLTRHLKELHQDKPFGCTFDGCDKRFAKRDQLKYAPFFHSFLTDFRHHLLTHSSTKPYACTHEGCTSSFKFPSELKKHVARVHVGMPCLFFNFVNVERLLTSC